MSRLSCITDIFGLQNKVGFVTGAASGIGAEMAQALASAGANVILADINISGAEAVAKLAFELDVSREDQVEQVVHAIVAQFGCIGSSNRLHESTTHIDSQNL